MFNYIIKLSYLVNHKRYLSNTLESKKKITYYSWRSANITEPEKPKKKRKEKGEGGRGKGEGGRGKGEERGNIRPADRIDS